MIWRLLEIQAIWRWPDSLRLEWGTIRFRPDCFVMRGVQPAQEEDKLSARVVTLALVTWLGTRLVKGTVRETNTWIIRRILVGIATQTVPVALEQEQTSVWPVLRPQRSSWIILPQDHVRTARLGNIGSTEQHAAPATLGVWPAREEQPMSALVVRVPKFWSAESARVARAANLRHRYQVAVVVTRTA